MGMPSMMGQTAFKGTLNKKTMMNSINPNASPGMGKTLAPSSNKLGFMTSKKSMAPSGLLQPSVGTLNSVGGSQSQKNAENSKSNNQAKQNEDLGLGVPF